MNTNPDTPEMDLNPHIDPPIGLALGSGMAKGFAHIGVIKSLLKHNIKPVIIAGTSIGALAGGCYLTGKLNDLEEWGHSLNRMKILSYLDFRVRSAGLIGGRRLVKMLAEHFEDTMIEDLPAPFVAIATDLVTGQEVWLRHGSLVKAMCASYAVPGIFPPVEMDHRLLTDGALVNPVPVAPCQALGSRLTIAVDLNSDLMGKARAPGQNYQKIAGFDVFNEQDIAFEDQKKFLNSSITRRFFRREENNPSLFGVMISSMNIIQDRLTRSRLGGDPPDIHIKPKIGHIGLLEFERAEELIAEGERAADACIPDIYAGIKALLPETLRRNPGSDTDNQT